MESVGGAVVVADDALNGDRLARELDALLDDPEHLASMGKAAMALGRPDATAAVATLVEQHARRQTEKAGARAR
jgi:UDP-N-acetylglucosamine--N-acetylmuramyl-(pentapeptide) pyrophosphoryl-undecaprenol N-acetylglucosamine transferase